jgi:acetoin utilization protein AcuB
MSTQLPISEFMTPAPHTIGAEQPLARAHEIMQKYEIRHLPVLHGGKAVGMLSLRDLHLVETLSDVDPALVPAEDAMTADLYVVEPDVPLAQVAEAMLERKLGSAVIAEGNRVLGVFTTTDALRALTTVNRANVA